MRSRGINNSFNKSPEIIYGENVDGNINGEPNNLDTYHSNIGTIPAFQKKKWKLWISETLGSVFIKDGFYWKKLFLDTKKYHGLHNITIGTNTITHNLNLPDGRAFTLNAIDSSGNSLFISNYSSLNINDLSFTSASAINDVYITII
jgi:hypothetical protein